MTSDTMEVGTSGLSSYYLNKIDNLRTTARIRSDNLRRLQAQRNDINAKGMS